MADVLFNSVSGLLAFQKALSVTSNNVANVATPGYSVERANFTPQLGVTTSVGSFGNGVDVTSVTRNYSELLAGQMRTSQSSYSGFNSFATTAASDRQRPERHQHGLDRDRCRVSPIHCRPWPMRRICPPAAPPC